MRQIYVSVQYTNIYMYISYYPDWMKEDDNKLFYSSFFHKVFFFRNKMFIPTYLKENCIYNFMKYK